jgi:hypothetical protein
VKLRVRKPWARYRALHRWHKWFAWYPVRVPSKGRMSDMTLVWLEFVERKGKRYSGYGHSFWLWEYKWGAK